MGFISQLSEKLEAQKIYDGMLGKYETRFKVEGLEYAFLATSVGGNYDDNTEWMLEFENIKSHRIGVGDGDKKVIAAFKEAVGQWVKERNPHCFYTYGSHIEPIQKIIEAVKKVAKGYNLDDSTADVKYEDGSIKEGNPVGKIKWTKMVQEDDLTSEDKANTKMDKNEEVFDVYEEPQDIKTDKAHMSGTSKSDKLDKNEGSYDVKEDFAKFKAEKLNESDKEE